MERLNHPHLIRMLEMIDSPKRIHIVMEFAGGCVVGLVAKAQHCRAFVDPTPARLLPTGLFSQAQGGGHLIAAGYAHT